MKQSLLYIGFFQVGARFGFGGRADLDIVDNLNGSGRTGHAGGGAFMLDHIRGPFPSDNSVGDFEAEAVFANFGFCKLGADGGFDLGIGERLRVFGSCGARGCRPGERRPYKQAQYRYEGQGETSHVCVVAT